MKRTSSFVFALLIIAATFSSCKRVESVRKEKSETITTIYKDGSKEVKSYTLTPPEGQPQPPVVKDEKAEKPKRLTDFKARKLLREQLRKENRERLTASFRIGYFECNDYNERLNLLKLEANGIIKMHVDEIITPNGPTYWVTAKLTWKGKWLLEDPIQGEYPEDRISEAEAKQKLIPALDQDEWGIPSTDTLVPAPVKAAMKSFYAGMEAGQTYDKSLVNANMACAIHLLDSLKSYGVDMLGQNPFVRDVQLTPDVVADMTMHRMPRLLNAYVVTLDGRDFLYVLDTLHQVMIEDIAYISPDELRNCNQTVCSLAGTLTQSQILSAREAKRQRDEWEARTRSNNLIAPPAAPVPPKDEFEMCATDGALKPVVHTDPTLYEIARKAQRAQRVTLFAGVRRVHVYDKELSGNKKEANATLTACYELRRVNAVGRIFLGIRNGEKKEQQVHFTYTRKDGWSLDGKGGQIPQDQFRPAQDQFREESFNPAAQPPMPFGEGPELPSFDGLQGMNFQQELPEWESEDESEESEENYLTSDDMVQ